MDDSSRMQPARKTPSDHGASFDAIKHVDEHGEWWSARELQPLMGYNLWRDFANSIERAKIACANAGMDVTSHFADARNVVSRPQGGGTPQDDYRLTRHGAYLVALNGDPRKAEVAAAQTYFAVRAREAELTQAELAEQPEWARQQIATILRVGKLEAEQKRHERRLTEVESRVDGLSGGHDWFTARAYARNHGLPTSLSYTRTLGKLAADLCRREGIQPEKVKDERFGQVGSYPEAILDEAYAAMKSGVA